MAVTFAVTGLKRDVGGSKRTHRGTITATGTVTAGGDAITPAALGLHVIESLALTPSDNGTLVFEAKYVASTGKIKFFGTNATPGAAVADPEVTAGTSVSTYAMDFEAVGT
jgi:hypothetical protein